MSCHRACTGPIQGTYFYKMKKEKLLALIKRSVEIYIKHEMGVYSGYTTFYLMVSFVPLMMMAIAVINVLPWFSVVDFSNLILRILPEIPQLRNAVLSVIFNLNRQSGALVIYVFAFTCLWTGSHGILALMSGLEKINQTKRTYFFDKIKSIFFAAMFSLLIPSMLFFQMLRGTLAIIIFNLFDRISHPEIGRQINHVLRYSGVVTLVAMIVIIVLTFTYLPSGKRKIRNQLPGAVFSSLMWIIFTKLFGFWISKFWSLSSVYGTLAAVFLAAMWLKFIINFLFYGAALNRAIQVPVSRKFST